MPVPGLVRGIQVLRLFNAERTRISAPEMARELGIPRSTVFRIAQTLEHLQLLSRTRSEQGYTLGIGVLALGFDYLAGLDLTDVAREPLQTLRDATGCSADSGRASRDLRTRRVPAGCYGKDFVCKNRRLRTRRPGNRGRAMSCNALVIGYGKIATYLATALRDDAAVNVRWVITRPGRENRARDLFGPNVTPLHTVDALRGRPDVALECAGHAALAEHGPALLRRGVDLGVLSAGALADTGLAGTLDSATREGNAQAHILAGAIGGMDALLAAREGGLEDVTYEGIKPPDAWRDSAAEQVCDLDALATATTFFQGAAREAARDYPKNANVAATVALCGIGLDATRVQLTADPDAPGNLHRIVARGAFGELEFTVRGRALPDHPRTSALTAMSAVQFLRSRVRQKLT